LRQGELALPESLLEEAMTVTEQLGEDHGKAWSLRYLGELALARGDYDRSRELLEEAVALASTVGEPIALLNSLVPLGRVARAQGDRQGARRLFEQARDMASAEGRAVPLQALGELAAEEGAPEDARRLFEEALGLARVRGNKQLTADALFALGQLARSAGERRRAAVLHDEALELRRAMASVPEIGASLEAIAGLAANDGRYEHAARLLGAAQKIRGERGYARLPWETARWEADLALVRDGLSEEALKAALSKGARLSLLEAAAEASSGDRGANGRPTSGWTSLTERERQVASLVSEGLTNAQIAERLFISLTTVRTHLSHIFAKLDISRRRDLEQELRAQG
ncbi:MAG: tetratricopeptide repeat protein, partial [Actinobacteria bacterium]|nr:tetratricopeptide repeat protein [Actinomycetota bacterium]